MNRCIIILIATCLYSAAADFEWQTPQAKALPNGTLEWTPQPFTYTAGNTVRYIDYENGKDSNPGTKAAPWKHHPWDTQATGNAKAHKGAATFVFKGGVIYRGRLEGKSSGSTDDPVRLTRDPSWGDGEAMIYGSHRIAGGWRKGGKGLADKVAAKAKIWYIDLPKHVDPRNLWLLKKGQITALPLARTPNWHIEGDDDDDPKEGWYRFRRTAKHVKHEGKVRYAMQLDPKLPKDPDFYEGSHIRYEWGPVMGTPSPSMIYDYDPKRHELIAHSFFPQLSQNRKTYIGSRRIFGGSRYSFEDNPMYVDEPGEWWLSTSGKTKGRLYLLPPKGIDPNSVTFEAGMHENLIVLSETQNLEIAGLTFRFSNMPPRLDWIWRSNPAAILHQGAGSGIAIRNNTFEHVNAAVHIEANDNEIDDILIADNRIIHADHMAIAISGPKKPGNGRVGHVRILRNKMYAIGFRPMRMHNGHAVTVSFAERATVAGNILHRTGGWGISISGGKSSGVPGMVPFARHLIFNNSVTDPMLFSNDWGGIETWQGGPFYVFNNHVHNPIGIMGFGNRRFGHAYYMDGAFKNYLFNNIASGRSSKPKSVESNTAAFQEIHSYQNTFFNNTAYRFLNASRRQASQSGRDKFLSNIFQDIGERAFRHSDSKNTDPNAMDAGKQKKHFDYPTNAYSSNIFHKVDRIGNFHALGGDFPTAEGFSEALGKVNSLMTDVGTIVEQAPLRDPANGDFRPTDNSAAIDKGSKVFVPWALYGVVGEWHFTPRRDDPTRILDEHWYMFDAHIDRHHYGKVPMSPLQAVAVSADDFTDGPLENWIPGALKLDGRKQYLRLGHETIAQPVGYKHKGKTHQVSGPNKPTVEIYEQNFLIEAYLKSTDRDGTLVQKLDKTAGYALAFREGKLVLTLRQGGKVFYTLSTEAAIQAGEWRHVIAEVDREEDAAFYIDGKRVAAVADGEISQASLANGGDFLVAKELACALDFLRVCHGTLADAKTSIDELYAWQFTGPALSDMRGRKPMGKRRDAGALELE